MRAGDRIAGIGYGVAARKTKTLGRRKLGQVIRGADTTVEVAWTVSFGSSVTGLPQIGLVPGMPNCWAALGYGGNGTTYARIATDVICGALSGGPTPMPTSTISDRSCADNARTRDR